MEKRLIGLTIAFLALTLIFWAIEFLWPSLPKQRRLRGGMITDALYWFFMPIVTKTVTQVAILVALVPPMLLLGRSLDRAAVEAGHGWVVAWPVWLQAVAVVLLGDFIGYWTHPPLHPPPPRPFPPPPPTPHPPPPLPPPPPHPLHATPPPPFPPPP